MNPVTFYKALADDTRLRCLLVIEQEQEACVCELTAALNLSQPKISRHLALLRDSKVIEDQRKGQWVFYRIHPDLPGWAKKVIASTLASSQEYINDSLTNLNHMPDRPQC